MDLIEELKALPSAQPEIKEWKEESAQNVSNGELILRKAAIEALGEKPLAWTESEYETGLQNQWEADMDAIKAVPSTQPKPRWIPVTEKLPDMHDAGILKKLGIKQRSDMVYITIEAKRNDGGVERITDTDAELRDGEWYSDTLRWLKAAEKIIEVTAWMPYPAPYQKEGEEG